MVGWLVGALIGSTLTEGLALSGVRGYEATGLVGFFLGAAVGIVWSLRILANLQERA
jgi:hypothetical protein